MANNRSSDAGTARSTKSDIEPSKRQIKDLFTRHVSSGKVSFFENAGIDFVLGAREGPYLWDQSGEKQLIDCHCNGGVFNLGHRNPQIVQVLRQATEMLDIGNHHLISQARATLASRLADLAPGELPYTVFAVGGGEAIDLAIKVARAATGRSTILSAKGGYHGHTGLALAAGDERYRAPFGPPATGFQQIAYNSLPALSSAMNGDTAAVLLETVPATYGMVLPEEVYLPGVRRLCDSHGALLIVDEIQAGLGRTGKLWGIQHFGVEPDILVIGKGLSGGIYPIAATCFRAELERVFHEDPFIHISTFGGAELGCVVAMQVLDLTTDQEFLDHVLELAEAFREAFARLQSGHAGLFVRLRQLGLMMGIEMANELCGPLFTKAAYDAGFLSVFANNDPRVAQFLPPLTIGLDLADELMQRVDEALSEVGAMLSSAEG